MEFWNSSEFQNAVHSIMVIVGSCGLRHRLYFHSRHFFHKIYSGKETVSWQLSSGTHKTDTVQTKAAAFQARQEPVCKWTLNYIWEAGRKGWGGGERTESSFEHTLSSPSKQPINEPISATILRVILTRLSTSQRVAWWHVCMPDGKGQ